MKKLILSGLFTFTSIISVMAQVAVNATSISICSGSCGTITATGSGGIAPYTYSWNPGASAGQNINVCPSSTTTYTVIATDNTGATASATATVTVNPNPVVSVPGATICAGNYTTLTASGASTYTWNPSIGLSATTGSSVNANPTVTTTYTVTGTATTTGCTATTTVVVTVNPNPVPTISGTTTICNGSSTTLTATGGGAYIWNTGQNTAAITVSPTVSSTTYTVTVATNGCTGTASGVVTVNPNPVADFMIESPVTCIGQAVTFADSSGGTISLWDWNFGDGSTSTVQNPIHYYAAEGTYISTLIISNAFGCTDSTSKSVTVQGSTLTGITVSDSIYKETCLGTGDGAIDITLSGSNTGPFTYQWNNGATTQDITNITSDNYTFTIFDASMNCLSTSYSLTPDGTNCGTMSGNVFDDKNVDCINDAGEDSLSNIMIVANPGNYTAFTNNQGYYVFNALPYNTYTVTQQISNSYIFPACASSLNATLNAGNQNVTNLDFADTVASIPKDVSVNAYSSNIVPGFSCYVNFYLYNLTGNATNGTFCLTLPPGYGSLVTSGNPSGYSVNGDTVCWGYSNFTTGSIYFSVYFTVPVNTTLGSTFEACGKATVIGTDINMANNYYCYQRTVTGSFDPNDKSVNPIGEGPQGNITLNDKTLNYHINFQNTGNGPAVNIVVKDSLSDKLDINTLEVTCTSHNYVVDVVEGNVLRWKFNNIMLADSGSNEPASHGWIDYRIKQKSSNQVGDQIKNTAYIYFDFNEAVVTNTTINTIAVPVSIKETTNSNNGIKVFPNPFSDNTTFIIQSGKASETYSFELLDVLGKQVRSIKEITTKEFQLSRNGLPNGVYFYRIYSAESVVAVGKLVVK